MDYGKTINNLRVDRMKQHQNIFAENIGISQTYLSQIETGKKKPSIQLLEKIAEYTEVPISVMFWKCLSENDINEAKIIAYRTIKPSIDSLINAFI